jgi:hypothetical protein
MKTQVKNLLVTLNENELAHLTNQVRETIALDALIEKTKQVFTAADLWNIHKMKRVRTGRRNFL